MILSVTKMAGLSVVRVQGDLDAQGADEFLQTLRQATNPEDGSRQVAIDMEDCSYIDSAGLGVLFSAASWVRHAGGRVAAVRPSHEILRILQLVRLTDERGFQVFTDLESAHAALQTTQRLQHYGKMMTPPGRATSEARPRLTVSPHLLSAESVHET